jgi:hypothetical protein
MLHRNGVLGALKARVASACHNLLVPNLSFTTFESWVLALTAYLSEESSLCIKRLEENFIQ